MRHFVLILLGVGFLTGCGCGADRAPSSIVIELADPLPSATYSLTVCVDDRCTQFTDVPANGEATVGGLEYVNTTDDGIHYSAFVAIAPGQHRVRVTVEDPVATVLSFDGDLDFVKVDRCHDTDSRVRLNADQLTVGDAESD